MNLKKACLFLALVLPITVFSHDFSINVKNKPVFTVFLKQSLEAFKQYQLQYDGNLLKKPLYLASVLSEYKNNERNADKKYQNKWLHIKAINSGIKKDFLENVYITIPIIDNLDAQLYVHNGDDPWWKALKKGEEVNLMCQSEGVAMETLIFKNCLLVASYLDELLSVVEQNIQTGINHKNYQPTSRLEATILINALAYALDEDNVITICHQNIQNCRADYVIDALNKKNIYQLEKQMNALDSIMKELPYLPQIKRAH